MAIKKSELYSSLWKSCDELRGGMDASQYKDYVLVILFVKYVTDKSKIDSDFLIDVPKGGSFDDMISLVGKKDIGENINTIIATLAEANDLKGIIDVADFDDDDKLGKGKDMLKRLSKLVSIFSDLDFGKNKAEGDDILGDAYEYLMRHFATESGKSKGQFYTPSEVSRIMAKVIGINSAKTSDQTVYDPTCGSGSLLLKAADEAQKKDISIYGQENDVATRALAKMNMILHGHELGDIWRGNTISEPHFKENNGSLKRFDFVVANPPFSMKSWSSGIIPEEDEFERYDIKDWGSAPPAKNGDYAFLLHIVKSLKSSGKGAIILPHGVLFRGNAEYEIRKNLIKRGYIKGIVGLPPNLFYGTGIPACIIILDKENAETRKGIFMIDASKDFYKDGNRNRLRSRDIHKIVDVFTKQIELEKYSRMIPKSEITDEKNDYNLNLLRYIDTQEEEDIQDIEAHLKGDIPNKDIEKLNSYWKVYPNLEKVLYTKSKRKNYSSLLINKDKIKSIIYDNSEFKDYSKKVRKSYLNWKKNNETYLRSLKVGAKPKEIIYTISEDILSSFSKLDLIDNYDMYQHMMTYWFETMQDDIYFIVINGWIIEINLVKNKKGKETGWDCDLIPKPLVIDKYFSKEQADIEALQSDFEVLVQEKEAFEEEQTDEDDIFSECRGKKGDITKGEINKRVKKIKNDSEFVEELELIKKYLELLDKEKVLKDNIKKAIVELDKILFKQYKSLTVDEIKDLVVEDKWFASISNSVNEEIERISQTLTGRINELALRYETPLPKLFDDVEGLTKKVNSHLEKMGFSW